MQVAMQPLFLASVWSMGSLRLKYPSEKAPIEFTAEYAVYAEKHQIMIQNSPISAPSVVEII